MVIGRDYIFVFVPRTASTWLALDVLPLNGGQRIERMPHHGADVPRGLRKGRKVFAVVRNPYARMWSIYHHLREHQAHNAHLMAFSQFIEFLQGGALGVEGLNQTEFLKIAKPDVVLKHEFLVTGLIDAGFTLPETINRRNTSSSPLWKLNLRYEDTQVVNTHSRPDFKKFAYEIM